MLSIYLERIDAVSGKMHTNLSTLKIRIYLFTIFLSSLAMGIIHLLTFPQTHNRARLMTYTKQGKAICHISFATDKIRKISSFISTAFYSKLLDILTLKKKVSAYNIMLVRLR